MHDKPIAQSQNLGGGKVVTAHLNPPNPDPLIACCDQDVATFSPSDGPRLGIAPLAGAHSLEHRYVMAGQGGAGVSPRRGERQVVAGPDEVHHPGR
jgi:hypothetical protein